MAEVGWTILQGIGLSSVLHFGGSLSNSFLESVVLPNFPLLIHLQGTVLIAVNPLRPVPDPDIGECMDKSLNPDAPHPYAIAEVRRA